MQKTINAVGEGWAPTLHPIFQMEYMQELKRKLIAEKQNNIVYPQDKDIFRAFKLTDPDSVRVLIIGQDPYHDGAADGLAFSVPEHRNLNPSIRNIRKEVIDDIGSTILTNGELDAWARQGVLLLNTVLTVNQGSPNSHARLGWGRFVNQVLVELSYRPEKPLVVILWGKKSQLYAQGVFTMPYHLVLEAPHPAAEGYSGGKAGFFGCKHFSKANDFLTRMGSSAISW